MGYGDQLMATGMARGAAARGKRIAFGDGTKILWDHNSEAIFRHNINIAKPGDEGSKDLEWISYYKGKRNYNVHDRTNGRWVWNYDFKPTPGEVTFSVNELQFAAGYKPGFVLLEPNVPAWKPYSPNKRWSFHRYTKLVKWFNSEGIKVRQFPNGPHIEGTEFVKAPDFRHAMALLSKASLYVGSEGGMHHAAAAFGIPAVVIFGGWIPPQVTGYDGHANISHGIACGNLQVCNHCAEAMKAISFTQVHEAVLQMLEKRNEPVVA